MTLLILGEPLSCRYTFHNLDIEPIIEGRGENLEKIKKQIKADVHCLVNKKTTYAYNLAV
jgi:hypothetical protein